MKRFVGMRIQNSVEDIEMKKNEPEVLPEKMESSDLVTEHFSIFEQTKTKKAYHLYLSETVESNYNYSKLCHRFRSFESEDQVTVHLASYGGYCSTGFQLVNAIRDSQASTIMVVDAPCYSMGAILAVSGNFLVMKPNTFLMFHNYSGGNYGKGQEHLHAVFNTDAWLKKAFNNVCSPFLTKKEMKLLEHDHDVYVHWDDKGDTERVGDELLDNRLKRQFPLLFDAYKASLA